MAFNKRIWKGRQGTGLNKFSINGATPVTVINQPDSVTEQGDALSAGNLNDLEDRIYIAFEDEATARANADSDLKDAIQANSNRIRNLEQEHGSYQPVNYRGTNAVPTGKAKYALVESIVGKSRAWNQLLDKSFGSSTTINNVTFTNNGDGSWSISTNGTASGTAYVQLCNNVPTLGHKWLISGCPSGGSGLRGFTLWDASNSAYDNGSGVIYSPTNAINVYIRVASGTSIPTPIVYRPILRDLSVIFPEGVPSTVAECVQKCPDILKYDAYGSSIVDTTVEGVKSVGFNLLTDDNVELGTYDANGAEYPSSTGNWWRTADFVDVKPCMTYYAKIAKNYTTANANIYAYFYDENGSFISRAVNIGNSTFETPPNCYKVNLNYYFVTATLQTPTEMCLNISGSEDGTFTPYWSPVILSFPSSVTLRSSGDGTNEAHDTFDLESGEITRNVLMETISVDSIYTRPGNTSVKFAVFTTSKPFLGESIPHKLTWKNGGISSYSFDSCTITNEMIVYSSGSHQLAVSVPYSYSKSDAEALLNGTPFNYAPNEVTTEQTIPVIDNTIATEGGGTINTIQTQTTVIDNCLDVGYLAL